MSAARIIPLRRYAGHRSGLVLIVLGNVAVASAAAVAYSGATAAGASEGARAAVTVMAALVVAAVCVVAWRQHTGAAVVRLVLGEGALSIVPARGPARAHDLAAIEARQLRYLAGDDAVAVPVLELRGAKLRPLQICGPAGARWPSQTPTLRLAPRYETATEDWAALTAAVVRR